MNEKVASTLRRIHQNLGHPPNRELIRHLRLSGASAALIQGGQPAALQDLQPVNKDEVGQGCTPGLLP